MEYIFAFFDITTIIYVLIGVSIIILVLLANTIRLEIRMRNLTKGKSGTSLEEMIVSTINKQDEFEVFRKSLEKYLEQAEKRLKRSTQGIETIRFNAFQGVGEGGNQSFASAFIDQNGDGLIISSIYARERMSVFAKPIHGFKSEYDLTGEEQEALKRAKEKVK